MAVPRLDVVHQFGYDGGRKCFRDEFGVERDHLRCLAPASNGAVGFDVCLLESSTNILKYLRILLCLRFLADRMGHLRHHAGDQSPIGGTHKIAGSAWVRRQPVGEIRSNALAAQEVWIRTLNEGHPALHRWPARFYDAPV